MARTQPTQEQREAAAEQEEVLRNKISNAFADLEGVMGKFQASLQTVARRANDVLPSAEARVRLADILRRFRKEGDEAPPVFFGNHRKPEAVLLSYQTYIRLLDNLDDLAVALELQRRKGEAAESVELEDFLRAEGWDVQPSRAE